MTAQPHILVVDDARDIREPLAAYLKRHSCRVKMAADAVEAVPAWEVELLSSEELQPESVFFSSSITPVR